MIVLSSRLQFALFAPRVEMRGQDNNVNTTNSTGRTIIPHFLDTLSSSAQLTPDELNILAQAGVTSEEDVQSLAIAFPQSLAQAGVRMDVLATVATKPAPHASATTAFPSDVTPPPSTKWGIGAVVTSVPVTSTSASTSASSPTTIDLLNGLDWPIRNQGNRGTSVAFAVTACLEYTMAEDGASPEDLSEQFLYWTTKTNTKDTAIDLDATRLDYAAEALENEGICTEADWPYCPDLIANNIGQGGNVDPTNDALTNAQENLTSPQSYVANPNEGGAAVVMRALQDGRPVAVTLPTFAEDASSINNWSTPLAWSAGRVLNPPVNAKVVGGHAVCIIGFSADPREAGGGYFVFRNSRGTQWGANAGPSGASHAPTPGYGDISASYIDRYLWEILVL